VCVKTENKVVILVEIYDKSELSTLNDNDYETALKELLESYSKINEIQ